MTTTEQQQPQQPQPQQPDIVVSAAQEADQSPAISQTPTRNEQTKSDDTATAANGHIHATEEQNEAPKTTVEVADSEIANGHVKEEREAEEIKVEATAEPEEAPIDKQNEIEANNDSKVENGASVEAKNEDRLLDMPIAGDRKFSVVSFREVCELYEIDLEKGERDRQLIKSKPSKLQSVRYYIMLLALVSPFVTTYSRTIINFAITDMIDPRFTQKQAADTTTTTLAELSPNATKLLSFDIDNSCPVDDSLRERLIDEDSKDTRRAQTTHGEKFEWDTFSQGLLKGAYSYGHAFFQIPGSRLSEIYGSHLVISINAMLIGTCCLVAPFLASLHFYLIFVDLMLLGVLGSFMTPAAITLFSNWLTPGEKTLMMSFMLVGSRLGYALSSFLCGHLLQADISWRYVFYSSGWVGLAFGVAFFLLARSRPKDHPLVSQLELDYLASKNTLVRESLQENSTTSQQKEVELSQVPTANGQANGSEAVAQQVPEVAKTIKKRKTGAPWLALATNMPLWAFVITKFCVKLAGDTAQIELPSYLKRVMHYSAADNGKVNAWNYVIFCIGCIIIGTLAKRLSKDRPFGVSKTVIRKSFQCVASFGVSLLLLAIGLSVCDKVSTEVFLMIFFFVTTFGMGGEAQSPLDLSERYSGTIHAIGSSLAISGAIEPTLVGYFLQGRSADRDQWKYVWLAASAISFIGGLVFLIFAEAEVQPFDRIGEDHLGEQLPPPKEEDEEEMPEVIEASEIEAVQNQTEEKTEEQSEVEKPKEES